MPKMARSREVGARRTECCATSARGVQWMHAVNPCCCECYSCWSRRVPTHSSRDAAALCRATPIRRSVYMRSWSLAVHVRDATERKCNAARLRGLCSRHCLAAARTVEPTTAIGGACGAQRKTTRCCRRAQVSERCSMTHCAAYRSTPSTVPYSVLLIHGDFYVTSPCMTIKHANVALSTGGVSRHRLPWCSPEQLPYLCKSGNGRSRP